MRARPEESKRMHTGLGDEACLAAVAQGCRHSVGSQAQDHGVGRASFL